MKSQEQEIFIPLLMNVRKGRRSYVISKGKDDIETPLSRLLCMAYKMEELRNRDLECSFNEFCRRHKISPAYLRRILRLNNLSPKLKKLIMEGYLPKHLTIQEILSAKMPLLWSEQEKWFLGKK